MKKIIAILTLAGSSLFFASCDKLNITAENVLQTSATTLASARSAAAVLIESKADAAQIGPQHKHTAVDIAKLPAAIPAYITKNYAGYTIDKAFTHDGDATGRISVIIKNGTAFKFVDFDAKGAFLKEVMKGDKGKFAPVEVAVKDLAKAVTDYITKNYPKATIFKAFKGVNNLTHVILNEGTTVTVLEFDANNVFVKVEVIKPKKG